MALLGAEWAFAQAPAPLQEACAVALDTMGDDYYRKMNDGYRERRDILMGGLREIGATMTQEWLERAGDQGQTILDAYRNE